jgi:oxygen-independent coproporphyrinogen-3 oxidase
MVIRSSGTLPRDVRPGGDGEFGVYVHVPFCSKRCDYCDFATWTDRHHLMADYVHACVAEIAGARSHEDLRPASSVFFGGGTPSLLPAAELVRMLSALELAPGAEVTVECNPENVTPALLDTYRKAGVTRISLGVQSMLPHVLASLGRVHRLDAVTRAVEVIGNAGFGTFNVDLIYGAAAENDEDWRRTLDGILALEPAPPHVSAYALTLEPGTPLWRDPARHPDDDAMAGRYEQAEATLSAVGFEWYEISNWARRGHECRHNLLYWRQGNYRGFGCAAHSHVDGHRFWNVRTPERYISHIESAAPGQPRPAIGGEERLDAAGRALEALELALRTRVGVPAAALPGRQLDHLEAEGLVEVADGHATLSVRGRLLANEVAIRLTPPALEAVPVRLIRDVMKTTEQRAPRL